ncbi:DeoR/GlpR family DNA-binding transcription regulator [Kineococcus radiotolerans]|uniref:Transcriptional regulator, DeoR family n=1 Tax=Kineococcus radiotolerans (strain ATCC BAA-149 / DSM 14245 / SRS30216) TaxID=266940 RepID=A6WG89_KINRD|nr:DeoR/GlpR family DNA-binding transcription regulator [Kineococcus radiotolerans]ABS05828.1 transcriptional regulator, DeoR family [Kineococcus radiotolerans SRS30216 = ATCC BAA-149]
MPSAATGTRRSAIVDLALEEGLAHVEALAARFEVSPSTIRRDLAILTAEGHIARTYGGAIPISAHSETTLRQRMDEAHGAKTAIGRWAATQIAADDTVLLDVGSTVGALAAELRGARGLTVITASLTVVGALSDADGVTVECLGGRLRPVSQGFLGPLTEAALERISADAVFLGTDGISDEGEICEADQQQVRLKELMARRADRVHVLAHGAKLGVRPFHAWVRLPLPWTVVTDATAPAERVAALRARGVEVVVVDETVTPT